MFFTIIISMIILAKVSTPYTIRSFKELLNRKKNSKVSLCKRMQELGIVWRMCCRRDLADDRVQAPRILALHLLFSAQPKKEAGTDGE